MSLNPILSVCVPALFLAQAAVATPDYVTDPALCQLSLFERQEQGMSFDGRNFYEIEYHCEIESALPPLDWSSDQTFIKAGYCEEPGALFPTVFVFRSFASDPRLLYVYEGQGGAPTMYHYCGG